MRIVSLLLMSILSFSSVAQELEGDPGMTERQAAEYFLQAFISGAVVFNPDGSFSYNDAPVDTTLDVGALVMVNEKVYPAFSDGRDIIEILNRVKDENASVRESDIKQAAMEAFADDPVIQGQIKSHRFD